MDRIRDPIGKDSAIDDLAIELDPSRSSNAIQFGSETLADFRNIEHLL